MDKIEVDFLTMLIIDELKKLDSDDVKVDHIIEICEKNKYLPNNRSDSYHFLNKLIMMGFITKIRNSQYILNRHKMELADCEYTRQKQIID